MDKGNRYFAITFSIFFILCILIYGIINALNKGQAADYFSVPFYNIINISIAVFFAYFLTQRRNDIRKKKEIAVTIIEKILYDLSNQKMYKITSPDTINHIRITQRSVHNRLHMLQEYKKEFNFNENLNHIQANFDLYWDTISNHINDMEYLGKSEIELYHLLTISINGLEKMIIDLYI